MVDYLGWLATALVVGSYFTSSRAAMRLVQMAGAVIWMLYGVAIGATPVIVSNILVCAAATWTMLRTPPEPSPAASADMDRI
jgi:hypothetical protein